MRCCHLYSLYVLYQSLRTVFQVYPGYRSCAVYRVLYCRQSRPILVATRKKGESQKHQTPRLSKRTRQNKTKETPKHNAKIPKLVCLEGLWNVFE
jgi:hypothetical protein